mgnify:CR=1 FL=1
MHRYEDKVMDDRQIDIATARDIVVAPIEDPDNADSMTWQVYAQGEDISDTTWLMDFAESQSAIEFALEILGEMGRPLQALTFTFGE